jgi:hypothetical protein
LAGWPGTAGSAKPVGLDATFNDQDIPGILDSLEVSFISRSVLGDNPGVTNHHQSENGR